MKNGVENIEFNHWLFSRLIENNFPIIIGGVLENDSKNLIKEFFQNARKK